MKWWLSRRVDEHFIFLSLSLLKKKSKKYFSLKYKYCLLSFCAQILYFVYIYILQLTIETNSPPRNLPFLLLMRSFPRSPPMRSTMAQSLTTLGDGTDWWRSIWYQTVFRSGVRTYMLWSSSNIFSVKYSHGQNVGHSTQTNKQKTANFKATNFILVSK